MSLFARNAHILSIATHQSAIFKIFSKFANCQNYLKTTLVIWIIDDERFLHFIARRVKSDDPQ